MEWQEARRQLSELGASGLDASSAQGLARAEEAARLREECAEAVQQLVSTQEELEEEKSERARVAASLKDREEEVTLLYETLSRFGVLLGVAPVNCARPNVDLLRRQLVEAEVGTSERTERQTSSPQLRFGKSLPLLISLLEKKSLTLLHLI